MSTPVTSLDQLNVAFAERFNARDVDDLLALFAPDAVFVPAPGQPLQGTEQVRAALEQFLALGLPISMTVRHVFASGGTGLSIADWSLQGAGPDGSEVSLGGSTADVAAYDETHGWRFVIDNPFGTA
ncbi:YybH family protein [Agromyces sp. NPDC058136]|uniref:YybH family protein n=1 Tax=Agromyces sp. NPDC058136 TaxID=3346354 RepID=UPI0036D96DA0